jgi:2-polyprenyl-6-methoxyphenol hydroxylase-like FAD-dependent oxidoreductase
MLWTSWRQSKRPITKLLWAIEIRSLNGLHEAALSFPNFNLVFEADVQKLVWDGDVCKGVEYSVKGQSYKNDADLVVGSDGRFSKIRRLGHFDLEYASHDLDVLWFEASRPKSYTHGADFFLSHNFPVILLPKAPEKIQCGIIVNPGAARSLLDLGAESLARKLNETHPMFEEFSKSLVDLHAFTVLQGKIEFVKDWAKNGLLLIGDAAHTCSPAGAIGVTIAVETAVVAAREILRCAKLHSFTAANLASVQAIRSPEIRRIHQFQRRFVHVIRNSTVHFQKN